MQQIIEIRGVTKTFKDVQAVNDLNLTLFAGQYTALLGPNGAGKTTLVEMIEGIQSPDSGEIRILGKGWQESEQFLRKKIGISLQETQFMDKLNVIETVNVFGSFHGLGSERSVEILHKMNLTEKAKSRVTELSGGQRQRLALGIALLANPEILLLDEPTTGLDPNARREIWNLLIELKSSGKTLLLTTHYMQEAEFLCDRIVVMDKGKILADGSLDKLLSDGGDIIEFKSKSNIALNAFDKMDGLIKVEMTNKKEGKLIVTSLMKSLPQFLIRIKKQKTTLLDLQCRKTTLDDLFVSMTGRRLDQ